MICDYLKPVIYTQKKFVFRVGEPLDSMLFIVEGTVIIYTTSSTTDSPSMIHEVLGDNGVYGGEQLMSWVSRDSTPDDELGSLRNLPISTKYVRCHTKVEGFSLTAKDLNTVLSKLNNSDDEWRRRWNVLTTPPSQGTLLLLSPHK